jgi:phosphoesterase RecJ-like protein
VKEIRKKTQEIAKLLKGKKNIVILTHKNPDGDAIGSSLALWNHLKKNATNVHIIIPDRVPDFLEWLPGADEIVYYTENKKESKQKLLDADLFFCLDFNSISRIEGFNDIVVNQNQAPKILIDHHPDPEAFARVELSQTWVSSTAELLYLVMVNLEGFELTKEIAECFYVGISTDTGNFSYNSSRPETFEVVAKLLSAGIDKNEIMQQVFNNFSVHRLKLLGYSINDKLNYFKDHHCAFISLSKQEMEDFNHEAGDTEGFVNYPLTIRGVKVSALFLEEDTRIKISFRSRGRFPVNELSKKHFNGGGHMNAAGGESQLSMDETIKKFIQLLDEYKEEIVNS